jgi:small-conductance mechanosensitive channel/CRP-like cAMP-binding protein
MPPNVTTERMLTLIGVVPLLYVFFVTVGRWLKRKQAVQLGIMYQFFSVILALYIATEWLGITFPLSEHLAPASVLLGTIFVLALIKRFLWEFYYREKCQIQIPKFFTQVVALVLFFVVLILVLIFGYDLRIPTELVAGSGIVAVILGLSMQDLLGNIFAGFALHFGKPFEAGDWLILDNRHAEVIEINWRSTRLRTNDNVFLDVPNNQISKQTIVNLTYPEKLHAMRLQVNIDYKVPPNRVKDAIVHATENAFGVSSKPKPKVFLHHFGESSIVYEIKFWMEDHARFNEIVDAIQTNLWYELQRRRIRIPFPIRTVQLQRSPSVPAEETRSAPRATLRHQPIFQCLDDMQIDSLLSRGELHHFGRSEKLIEQGKDGESMFILIRGLADVLVNRNGEAIRVGTLRSGECFGEVSLLTGEKRTATVVAQTDCEVVEIDKSIMAEFLQNKPDLLQKLSELLARRKLETDGVLAENAQKHMALAKQREYTAGFLAKLKSFFEL